jgi:hypothetical protein
MIKEKETNQIQLARELSISSSNLLSHFLCGRNKGMGGVSLKMVDWFREHGGNMSLVKYHGNEDAADADRKSKPTHSKKARVPEDDDAREAGGQSGTFLTPEVHQLLPLPKKTGGRGGGSSSVGGGRSAASVHATPPTLPTFSGEMRAGAEEHDDSGDGAQTPTDGAIAAAVRIDGAVPALAPTAAAAAGMAGTHQEGGDSRAVGARVEVLWDGERFAAEVLRCHNTGQYDVVYEEDGQLGTFLTPEVHLLLPLLKKTVGGRGGGSASEGGGQKRTVTSEGSADLQSAQPLQENREPTKEISRQRQAVSLGAFAGSMKGEVSFAKDELVTVLVRCAFSP